MNKILSLLLIAIVLCLPAFGMYIMPELKDLPLERLIKNLTERTQAEPGNSDALHQLARTHAMAYARKIGDAEPVKAWNGSQGKDPQQPFFGFDGPHVPFNQVAPTAEAQKAATAKAHLAKAIEVYEKALAAKPADPTIKLGLAWCRDQAGEKLAAMTLYRGVAAVAWEKENKSLGGLGNFLYVETVGYLIPLLDPARNADEIAVMKQRQEKLLALPRAVTPLIIPVGKDNDINALVNRHARVHFDLDATGRQLAWPWITKDAAWLVFDPQNSGKVTSAIQMFGSRSFLLFCRDGYQALALLDDNGDGVLSGPELAALALWRDTNADGLSDPGEVRPVADYGITTLSTHGQPHDAGFPFCPTGVTFKDGTTRPTYDLILQSH
ncbi:MAG: hypothetical protein K8R23_12210 [Chthoniobacter sp.]|nr:hypothetical protein [Chthoniobacter sp.]